MSANTKLFLGLRKENGQIGYLSESLTIPEFFDLIRPSTQQRSNLVDFSPVIKALHSSHARLVDQSIIEKYNSVFNYWQESKSYSNMQIRLSKFENLSLLSNELINSLQFKIEKSEVCYGIRRRYSARDNLRKVEAIQSDCNVYIDVLLCFIHSKASLEIESFKNDVVLGEYCDFLLRVIKKIYNDIVDFSTWNNEFRLSDSSLLYYLAFKENKEVNYYTKLLPLFDGVQDLRMRLINVSCINKFLNDFDEEEISINVKYRNPHPDELKAAKILRNLLYKTYSIAELIKKLKEGGIDWDSREFSIEELQELVTAEIFNVIQ